MDTKTAQKYFYSYGNWGMLVIGVLTIPAFIGIGIIAYWLFQNRNALGRPTDTEFDNAVASKAGDIKAAALKKIGIDESEMSMIAPIVFFGPSLDAPAGRTSLVKQGKDGLWRTSAYQACAIFFSENQVFLYTRTWSMINDNRQERTEEYFYGDIVSVTTSSESESMEEFKGLTKVQRTIDLEAFSLRTTGGDAAKAGVDPKFAADIERQIQGMKNLVRDKKLSAKSV